MPAPHLATSTDIVAWADGTQSRADFPNLVRRLILETAEPTRLSFRAEEGTDLGGYDGWVEAPTHTAHVPAGTSVWELGTNKKPKPKADGDLKARTQNPDPADPAATEFVFCTPRRWPGKDDWAEAASASTPWRNVRAYDVDDFAAWLASAPGTHVWFSARIGLPVGPVEDLRSWWTVWSAVTVPSVTPKFLAAGRTAQAEALLTELHSGAGVTIIRAGSPAEARAFVASSLTAAGGPEAERLLNSALVVDDRSTWRYFAAQRQPLLLLPSFRDDDGFYAAVQNGHRVVLAVGPSFGGRVTVKVPPLSAVQASEVLSSQGLSSAEARHGAALARRSLAAYRRLRAPHPLALDPSWAAAPDGPILVGPVLVGRWDSSRDDDRALVESVAGRPYAEVEAAIQRSAEAAEPAFKRTGSVWKATAKELAWIALSRHATADDVRRTADLAVEALLEDDPLHGLGSTERFMAQHEGTERPHSGAIRKGLADSLAMLGALGAAHGVRLADGSDPQPVAAYAVRRLLEACRKEPGRWPLLAPHLPDLAEAAPDTFLSELEGDLQSNEPTVLKLFEPQPGLLSPDFDYPSLLWALERLAWSPDHLVRVARVLGQIEAAAPPTRLVNSAYDSLKSFFRPWLPQCGGTLDTRLAALDHLRAQTPDIAWRLMLAMIKTGHDSASIRSGPGRRAVLWGSWPSEAVRPTVQERLDTRRAISERLVEDAGAHAGRWVDLAGRLHEIDDDIRERAIASLVAACREMTEPERTAVWEALRSRLAHHGSFPDAPWSMGTDTLNRLQAVADEIRPQSHRLAIRWMFEQRPNLLRTGDRDEWNQLARDRHEAVADLLAAYGLEGVTAFAAGVEASGYVGDGLAAADTDGLHAKAVLDLLQADEGARDFALGYLHHAIRRAYPDPIASALGADWSRDLSPEVHALVLRQRPLDHDLLIEIDSSHPDVRRSYWRTRPFTWTDDPDLRRRTVESMLDNGFPRLTLDTLTTATDSSAPPGADLVARVIHAAITTPLESDPNRIAGHDLVRLLAYLNEHDDDRQRVAELEWLCLPLVAHDAPQLSLHDELAANPTFFLDVVETQYKNDDGATSEHASPEANRAAYHLLGTWRRLPGVDPDGSFVEDEFDTWVRDVLDGAKERGYVTGTYLALGQTLTNGPHPQDGMWPHPAVCRVIENAASDVLDEEFRVAVYNSRGTTSRGSFDGGAQEQTLAQRYDAYATAHAHRFPRVAALLRRMAATYRSEARWMDLDVEHREDDLG